jgi:VWFA-related protein
MSSSVRARSPGIAAVLLLLSDLLDPDILAQTSPTLRTSSSLVLVPVSALDKSGHFVSGLSARNFQILVDGKPVELRSFDAITEDSIPFAPVADIALPPNTFRNISVSSVSQPNLVILFVDYLNTRLVDRMELRKGMLKYLATKLKPDQEIAVYGLTYRLVVLQPFTRDSSGLIAVAKNLLQQKGQVPDPKVGQSLVKPAVDPMTYLKGKGADAGMEYFAAKEARREYNLDQLHRAQRTLEAFRELAGSFGGIPGKKTVIWLTGDASPLSPTLLYRILVNNNDVETVPTRWSEMAKTYELLNAANISVFPVDIRGIANPGMLSAQGGLSHDEFQQTVRGSLVDDLNPYSNRTDLREGEAANAVLAMDAVAAETGATVLAGSNDVAELLGRAHKLWASYYVLAFVPKKPANDNAPAYHKIKVTVDRPGVQILARRGYVSRPETLISADTEIQRDLLEAAASPTDLTSVAMQLTLEKPRDSDRTRQFPFSLVVPGALLGTLSNKDASYDLTFAVLVLDQDGRFKSPAGVRLRGIVPQAAIPQASQKGLNYNAEFHAPIGSLSFGRVIVRDNLTGRTGTITLALPTTVPAL